MKNIIMYSTNWCGDCVRSKKVFDKLGIAFREVDIDYDKEGFEIAAAFDLAPTRERRTEGARVPVYSANTMADFIRNHQVRMAIIAVPSEAAQNVVNGLVEAGASQIELQGGYGGGGFIGTLGLSFNNFSLKNIFISKIFFSQ